MNTSPSPSTPPRGTRVTMVIERMHLKPLPVPSADELDRLRRLLRKRPLPRRAAR